MKIKKYISSKLAQFKQWILSIVIKRSSEKLIGKKGKERWYPKYAPHIILGTNQSILDVEDYCNKNGYYKDRYWFPFRNVL